MMKRKFLWRSMVLLAIVMLLVMAGANLLAAPLSPAPEGVPSPVNGKIDVLIGFEGTPNPGLVRAFGGEIYAEFTIVDVIAARIPQQVTDALQKRSEVSYVELDKPMYTTGQSYPGASNGSLKLKPIPFLPG
jgi:subtilisin